MPLLKKNHYTIEDIYALPEGPRAELIDVPVCIYEGLIINVDRLI